MRLAFGISYCGKGYYGWQKQLHSSNTIQYWLEKALSAVANQSITSYSAGRTDSGVHATGQVIHIETDAIRSLHGWQMGVNTHLPVNIRVNWVAEVSDNFHARFSANYRRYQYIIEENSIGHALFAGLITPYRHTLVVEKMHEAAQYLLGENDFSSFRAAQCQSNTSYRHIDAISVIRKNQYVIVDIQANAFLYHMVRNIVGALFLVGEEKQSPKWMGELLAKKCRQLAPATAIADGLYLVEIGYSLRYNIVKGGKLLPFLYDR
ncbi:MAG: tRNA pseudouridine(38-40) synthase TruA [Ostreibacterium sp.]